VTEDVCVNPGAVNSVCVHNPIVCKSNNDCNDSNPVTEDVCANPGTVNSTCIHTIYINPIVCKSNNDCKDSNPVTEDVCINPGTVDSICIHNIYINVTNNVTINVTNIKFVSFVAVPGLTTVTLNFSATSKNNSFVRGFLLSKDHEKWILVLSPVTGYIFDGLSPSTSYLFYAKAIDDKNMSSDEMNISVRTLDVPPVIPPSGGGGGGGSSGVSSVKPVGGSAVWCSTEWQCSTWSDCTNNIQTRTCSFPAGMCKPVTTKPIETQSCVETPSTEAASNNAASPTTDVPADNNPSGTNSITGASIAGLLGKNSWIAAVAVLVIAGIAYYFVRKWTVGK